MKHGKKYQDSVKLIDHLNQYDPDQAAQLVVSTGKAKFDETEIGRASCRERV